MKTISTSEHICHILAECQKRSVRVSVIENGKKLLFDPVAKVSDLIPMARQVKNELIGTLQYSQQFGHKFDFCPVCHQKTICVPTIDGFANIECIKCRVCLGCRPATREAIEKYGNPEPAAPAQQSSVPRDRNHQSAKSKTLKPQVQKIFA